VLRRLARVELARHRSLPSFLFMLPRLSRDAVVTQRLPESGRWRSEGQIGLFVRIEGMVRSARAWFATGMADGWHREDLADP
jgi:hypothetical protein